MPDQMPCPRVFAALALLLAPADATAQATYAEWKTLLGLPSDISSADDSDRDGVPLLIEYALDLSPFASSTAFLPLPVRVSQPPSLQWSYPRRRADILYHVEASADLGAWSVLGVDQGTAPVGGMRTVVCDLLAGEPARFLRLQGALASTDATIVGTASAPFPTFEHLSLVWDFTGDADADAVVQVRFRPMGADAWRAGLPLRRVPAATNEGFSWTNRHAGSLFALQPGTTYEIELALDDPDGGSTTQRLTATTRTLPSPAPGAPVRGATPGTLSTVLAAAQPGDIVELGAGSYPGFGINRSGSPGLPLVIRGVPGAVVNGEIGLFSRAHVFLTALTVNGRIRFNGSSHITITRCTVNATATLEGHGIVCFTRGENSYIADNTVTGLTVWEEASLGASGNNLGEGILVTGPGHVIAHNRVLGFRDGISFMEDGGAVDQFSIDVLNNDISACADDGIEADFAQHNCRILRNRLTNTFIALSSQPGLGGPTYFVRNVAYNVVHIPFKLYRGSQGDVLLHNTVVKNGDAFAASPGRTITGLYARNNLFLGGPGGTYNGFSSGTGRVIALADLIASTSSLDFDAYGSTTGAFLGRIQGVTFDSLATLRSRTSERSAQQITLSVFAGAVAFPGAPLTIYAAPDLRPAAGSPVEGTAERLPNINDTFSGSAPDIGALEAGATLPGYGPR